MHRYLRGDLPLTVEFWYRIILLLIFIVYVAHYFTVELNISSYVRVLICWVDDCWGASISRDSWGWANIGVLLLHYPLLTAFRSPLLNVGTLLWSALRHKIVSTILMNNIVAAGWTRVLRCLLLLALYLRIILLPAALRFVPRIYVLMVLMLGWHVYTVSIRTYYTNALLLHAIVQACDWLILSTIGLTAVSGHLIWTFSSGDDGGFSCDTHALALAECSAHSPILGARAAQVASRWAGSHLFAVDLLLVV